MRNVSKKLAFELEKLMFKYEGFWNIQNGVLCAIRRCFVYDSKNVEIWNTYKNYPYYLDGFIEHLKSLKYRKHSKKLVEIIIDDVYHTIIATNHHLKHEQNVDWLLGYTKALSIIYPDTNFDLFWNQKSLTVENFKKCFH